MPYEEICQEFFIFFLHAKTPAFAEISILVSRFIRPCTNSENTSFSVSDKTTLPGVILLNGTAFPFNLLLIF